MENQNLTLNVNTQDLKESLNYLSKFELYKNPVLYLKTTKHGIDLSIYSVNYNILTCEIISDVINENIEVELNFKNFKKLLSKIKPKDFKFIQSFYIQENFLILEITNNIKKKIKCKISTRQVEKVNYNKFVTIPISLFNDIFDHYKLLLQDSEYLFFKNLLLRIENNKLNLVLTNGSLLTLIEYEHEHNENIDLFLPIEVIKVLESVKPFKQFLLSMKYIKVENEIFINLNYVNDNITLNFQVKVEKFDYPEYQKVIPQKYNHINIEINKKNLLKYLSVIDTTKDNEGITLNLLKDKIIIKNDIDMEYKTEVIIDKNDFKYFDSSGEIQDQKGINEFFALNKNLFEFYLKTLELEKVFIKYYGHSSPLVINENLEEEFYKTKKLVIMPMRVNH